MGAYVDEAGVENVAVGIIKQARKDFIKGGKVLYGILKRIPTYNELIKDEKHVTLSNNYDVRMMYDSWRFVAEDPYQLFGDEDTVINAWKKEAIEQHYKILYLKGAEILFSKHISKDDIKNNDNEITRLMGDNKLAEEFIAARNYIYSVPDGDKTAKEWNVTAFARSKHPVKGKGRIPIQDTKFRKDQSEKRQKNVKRAKEMYEEGLSAREIAEELELSLPCVRNYLRS